MRTALPTLFLVLATSCGGESPPQLVRGRVERATFPPTVDRVNAWTASGLAARAPIDDEGHFLLALAPGGPYRVELASADGHVVASLSGAGAGAGEPPAPIEVCSPEAVFPLGVVRAAPALCQAVQDCASGADALNRCLIESERECASLEQQHETCRVDARRQCNERREPPACVEMICAPIGDQLRTRCGAPCAEERRIVGEACMPRPCASGALVALAERAMPHRFGCGPEGGQ